MGVFGFIITLILLRDFLKVRKILLTWGPVLQEFEKRIPLINQLGAMWGKLQQNLKTQSEAPTKEQMKVREKIVTNIQSELPSNLPVIGTALAQALAKLSGNEKAIMLTDTEFLGSMLKLVGKASEVIGGVTSFLGGRKESQTEKKPTKRKRILQAPDL